MTEYNRSQPLIMHIDLNSCFASVEQQARPMLRYKPVVIANRLGVNSAIITASYEAKSKGVKAGMRLKEARALLPNLICLEAEPSKYRYVYKKLLGIMNDYSGKVTMKSIDEGLIDFSQSTKVIKNKGLESIGQEIKYRLKSEIGCYIRCNIGIATNRFLAKTAAGLHKPDGLDIITADNLRQVFSNLKLTDLTGIAKANEIKLNSVGITTPLEFLDAPLDVLKKVVFKSICGEQWHKRLRGFEVDDFESDIKSVGRQYVLESSRLCFDQIIQRLFHLSEQVGERLRQKDKQARGVYVYAKTYSGDFWHKCKMQTLPFYSNQAIFTIAKQLFIHAPNGIREIGITCYGICDPCDDQLSIFGDELIREQNLTRAVDSINLRFGSRKIHSAETLHTGVIKTKIPFGSTRYL